MLEILDEWGRPRRIYIRGTALDLEALKNLIMRAAEIPGDDVIGHFLGKTQIVVHAVGPPIKRPVPWDGRIVAGILEDRAGCPVIESKGE